MSSPIAQTLPIPGTVVPIGSLMTPGGEQGIPGAKGDKGDQGEEGTGVTIKGTVPTSANLPTTGNTVGDVWITSDTGHGWSWDGTQWVDIGPIQGPLITQGPPGGSTSIFIFTYSTS